MKKRILCIALCVILIFSFSSCRKTDNKGTTETTETVDDNDPYTFNTVADLKSAIKKEPSLYEDNQVTVKGSISKMAGGIILTDAVGDGGAMFSANARTSPNITIIVPDDKKVTLLDSGDRVEIIGTVKISDVEIYLDACDYKIITSIYD